jgi:hypothetical protein
MSRSTWHWRNGTLPSERRPVPRWRYVAVFVCAGTTYFVVSALDGDHRALRHTVIWLAIVGPALGLLWLWNRLPTRARSTPPRFTRGELIRASFEGIFLFSVIVLPDPIRHGVTAGDWVSGPIIVLIMVATWLVFVLPGERRGADVDASEARLLRPPPRPKVR